LDGSFLISDILLYKVVSPKRERMSGCMELEFAKGVFLYCHNALKPEDEDPGLHVLGDDCRSPLSHLFAQYFMRIFSHFLLTP
jgi:hypothetical protein